MLMLASVAQGIEQWSSKPLVAGSNPAGGVRIGKQKRTWFPCPLACYGDLC